MRKDRKKYMKPNMEIVLLKTRTQLLEGSPIPLPIDPEPNPFQW